MPTATIPNEVWNEADRAWATRWSTVEVGPPDAILYVDGWIVCGDKADPTSLRIVDRSTFAPVVVQPMTGMLLAAAACASPENWALAIETLDSHLERIGR